MLEVRPWIKRETKTKPVLSRVLSSWVILQWANSSFASIYLFIYSVLFQIGSQLGAWGISKVLLFCWKGLPTWVQLVVTCMLRVTRTLGIWGSPPPPLETAFLLLVGEAWGACVLGGPLGRAGAVGFGAEWRGGLWMPALTCGLFWGHRVLGFREKTLPSEVSQRWPSTLITYCPDFYWPVHQLLWPECLRITDTDASECRQPANMQKNFSKNVSDVTSTNSYRRQKVFFPPCFKVVIYHLLNSERFSDIRLQKHFQSVTIVYFWKNIMHKRINIHLS